MELQYLHLGVAEFREFYLKQPVLNTISFFLQQQSESLLLIAFLTDDSVIELFIYLKLFIWHVN